MAEVQPIRYKNPFALIQQKPDPWQGLAGATDKGFLIFKDVASGLRAGFINLRNAYFAPYKGVTTTRQIFPKYVGTKWGEKSAFNDDPIAYANSVKKFAGIGIDEPISMLDKQKMVALAKAIIQVEAGKLWVNTSDIEKAYDVAFGNAKNPVVTAGMMPGTEIENDGVIYVFVGVIAFLGIAYFAFKEKGKS